MESDERVCHERGLRDAVIAGDERAWRVWYDATFPALLGYVHWRCAGLRDATDEVVQETWLTAVRRLRGFDPERASFLNWLRGIAANVLRNRWRDLRLRNGRVLPISAKLPAATPDAAVLDQPDRAERIAHALARLPDRHEAVLRAKYLDGRTVADIAAEWGETPKAVESLLTRARQAFREAYRPE